MVDATRPVRRGRFVVMVPVNSPAPKLHLRIVMGAVWISRATLPIVVDVEEPVVVG